MNTHGSCSKTTVTNTGNENQIQSRGDGPPLQHRELLPGRYTTPAFFLLSAVPKSLSRASCAGPIQSEGEKGRELISALVHLTDVHTLNCDRDFLTCGPRVAQCLVREHTMTPTPVSQKTEGPAFETNLKSWNKSWNKLTEIVPPAPWSLAGMVSRCLNGDSISKATLVGLRQFGPQGAAAGEGRRGLRQLPALLQSSGCESV